MARKAYNGYTEKSYYDNTKFSGVVASTDALNEGNFKEMINLDISDTGASVKPRKGFLTTAVHCPKFDVDAPSINDVVKPTDTVYTEYKVSDDSGALPSDSVVITNFYDCAGAYVYVHLDTDIRILILPNCAYADLPEGWNYYTCNDSVYTMSTSLAGTRLTDSDTYYISNDGKNFTCIVYDGLPYTYEAQILSIDISEPTSPAKHAGDISASGMCITSSTPLIIPSAEPKLPLSNLSLGLLKDPVPIPYWTFYSDNTYSYIPLPEFNTDLQYYNATLKHISLSAFSIEFTNDIVCTINYSEDTGDISHVTVNMTVATYDVVFQGIPSLLIDLYGYNNPIPLKMFFTNPVDNLSYTLDIFGYFSMSGIDTLAFILGVDSLVNNVDNFNTLIEYINNGYRLYQVNCSEAIEYDSDVTLYQCSYTSGKYIISNSIFSDMSKVTANNIKSFNITAPKLQIYSDAYTNKFDLSGYFDNDGIYYIDYTKPCFIPVLYNTPTSFNVLYNNAILPDMPIEYIMEFDNTSNRFKISIDLPLYTDISDGTFISSNTNNIYSISKGTEEGRFVLLDPTRSVSVSKIVLQNMNTHPIYLSPYILSYNNARSVIDLSDVTVSSITVQVVLPDACASIPEGYTDASYGSNLTSITLPYECVVVYMNAFKDCNKLSYVSFNPKLERIGMYAFAGCSLRGDIVFGEYLENIFTGVFENSCKDVTSIVFNSDVILSEDAFKGYSGIVKYPNTLDINENAFDNATFKPCTFIKINIESDKVCLRHNGNNVLSYTHVEESELMPPYLYAHLQLLDSRYEVEDISVSYYDSESTEYKLLDESKYEYSSSEHTLILRASDGTYYSDYKITPNMYELDISGDVIHFNDILIHRSGIYTVLINKTKVNDYSSLFGYVYTNIDTDTLNSTEYIKYLLSCDKVIISIDTNAIRDYCLSNYEIYKPGDDILSRLYIPDGYTRITTPMLNEYGITRGIIRVRYRNDDDDVISETDPQLLLAFTYRPDAVVGNGTAASPQYPANSLVVEVVNTQEQYSATVANLASKRPIIPDDKDKQVIYTPEEIINNNIIGFINSFNFMYVRNKDSGKYLMQHTHDFNFTLIPSFQYLDELQQGELKLDTTSDGEFVIRTVKPYNNDLLYTYKIRSTQNIITTPDTETSETVYYGPVCKLTTNENVSSMIESYGDYNDGIDDIASSSASHNSIFNIIKLPNGTSLLQCDFYNVKRTDPNMVDLDSKGFFLNGLHIEFYVIYAPYTAYINAKQLIDNIVLEEEPVYNAYADSMTRTSLESLAHSITTTRLILTSNPNEVTYMDLLVSDNYDDMILHADGMIVFKPVEGDRLVLWKDNLLFISEANVTSNTEGFFTLNNMFTFDEPIVKAITYKTLILVFTTQTLYAVYPYTDIMSQEETNEEGETTIKQVEYTAYAKLPVLYNIMCNKQYSDAIQVYNQMILFYSSDGQMFLIKPSTTIDSDTRFTLQYFNKSVNDVLLNYDEYINERVKYYGIDIREKYPEYIDVILDGTFKIPKRDINIKVQSNINYIKIYYCVPGVITYILVYNVLNNYWYMYDTISFTDIREIMYIQSGDLFITRTNGVYYLTFTHADANVTDNNCDMAIYNNFTKEPIKALLDTGNLSLNNHLRKRFRNLHITYKNLNASKLKYNFDVIVDDILVDTNLQATTLDVKDVSNFVTSTPIDYTGYINLLEDRSLLFDLSLFTSNKILTYITNIPNMGNVVRFKFYLESKGVYKVLSYGLVYKERTV